MNKKKTVFCEIDFLTRFMSSFPEHNGFNDENVDLLSSWINFYKFLCKSELALNMTKEEYWKLAHQEKWAQKLWKKNTDGLCHLDFRGTNFPEVKEIGVKKLSFEEYNSIYLTTQPTEICKKLAEVTGVIILNNDLCLNCEHLFKDNGTSFPNENAKDWYFMDSMNGVYPKIRTCNSMIIVDPYLLIANEGESFKDKLRYNLEPILRCILPIRLKDGEAFEITFFTSDRDIKDYYAQYEYVKDLVSKLRPEVKFELTIYRANNFHDRCIITNNIWIGCGHGFDVFDKNGNTGKQTSVSIAFPFIQFQLLWCDNSYINVIAEANVVKQKPREYPDDCWGNFKGKNRILAFYFDGQDNNKVQHSDIKNVAKMGVKVIGKMDLSKFSSKNKVGKKALSGFHSHKRST